jgi:hypothetical protein
MGAFGRVVWQRSISNLLCVEINYFPFIDYHLNVHSSMQYRRYSVDF